MTHLNFIYFTTITKQFTTTCVYHARWYWCS